MTQVQVNEEKMREIQKNFNAMDDNADGQVTHEEVRKLVLSLGDGVKPGEVEKIIAESDKNGDGNIDFEEFLAAATKLAGSSPKKKAELEYKLRHEYNCMCKNKGGEDHEPHSENEKGGAEAAQEQPGPAMVPQQQMNQQ